MVKDTDEEGLPLVAAERVDAHAAERRCLAFVLGIQLTLLHLHVVDGFTILGHYFTLHP